MLSSIRAGLPSRKGTAPISAMVLLGLATILFCCSGKTREHDSNSPRVPSAKLWVTAYYTPWGACAIPPQTIDYSAVTHIAHFGPQPYVPANGQTADGIPMKHWTLPEPGPGLNAEEYFEYGVGTGCARAPIQADLIRLAHQAGTKVLLCLGGTGGGNAAAMADIGNSEALRQEYISSVLAYAKARGYDGVDIDWEYPEAGQIDAFRNLIQDLRSSLNAWTPRGLLTISIPMWAPNFWGFDYALMDTLCDQVNVMFYDMSSTSNAHIGYNAPLHGPAVPYYDGFTIDYGLQQILDKGIRASKLGLGMPFYGYVWHGQHAPGETRTGSGEQVGYEWVLQHKNASTFHQDTTAKVPWLGNATQEFISYDDEESIAEKVNYARENGFGGVMIWELWRGLVTGNPPGKQEPLLSAVKRSVPQAGDRTREP